jgi:hypothetical protein
MGLWDLICEAFGFFSEDAVKEVAKDSGSSEKEAREAGKYAASQIQLERTMEYISEKDS